jgi:hypothetical protein
VNELIYFPVKAKELPPVISPNNTDAIAQAWARYRIAMWGVEYMGREGFDAAVKELLREK